MKLGPVPKNTPPKTQDEVKREDLVKEMASDMQTSAVLRLIELLIKRNILDATDVLFVLGGGNAPSS